MIKQVVLLLIGTAACAAAAVDAEMAKAALASLMERTQTRPTIIDAIISLPYGHINEPARFYMDEKNNRSRTEYYEGQDVYIYNSSGFGQLKQIVPAIDTPACFLTQGVADSPISLQYGLPTDIDNYDLQNETVSIRGFSAFRWVKNESLDGRTNLYEFYMSDSDDGPPLFFKMTGYDYVFGSHYDVYTIDYLNYRHDPIDPSLFTQPKGMKCGDFPGPGMTSSAQRGGFGFVERSMVEEETHVDEHFGAFMDKHNKSYEHEKEQRRRRDVFRHNQRYIDSHNRKNVGFKLAVNHFADWYEEELKVLRGARSSNPHTHDTNVSPAPEDFADPIDWRTSGAVTYVKDQGICGSCWSFAATEALEGQLFFANYVSIPLSQQSMMDCSWLHGNNACDGGEANRAYDWVKEQGGIPSQFDYGLYEMADGTCHVDDLKAMAAIKDYTNITNATQLATGLKAGPVAVAIDASHKSFVFYHSGVYFEPDCGNTEDDLDHAVLAVGMNSTVAGDYWIVKNSWSTYWGNEGYVYMSAKNNNCGVATDGNQPILA